MPFLPEIYCYKLFLFRLLDHKNPDNKSRWNLLLDIFTYPKTVDNPVEVA